MFWHGHICSAYRDMNRRNTTYMWILGSKPRRSFPAFTETFVFNLFCLSRAARLERLGFGHGSIPCALPEKIYMVMMFLDQKSRIPQQIQQSQKHGWFDILVGGFKPSEKYERQWGWFFPIYIYILYYLYILYLYIYYLYIYIYII